MCKYCKHLQEVRNLERKSYDRVIAHLKKELRQDENLMREVLSYINDCFDYLSLDITRGVLRKIADGVVSITDMNEKEQENVTICLSAIRLALNEYLGKEGDE